MGVAGSRLKNQKGEHVIILAELGGHTGGYTKYALANLDRHDVQIDFNARSLGTALSNLSQSDWKLTDEEKKTVKPREKDNQTYSAGLVKGMKDTADDFAIIFNSAYLDLHGFTKIRVYLKGNTKLVRYSLKIGQGSTPFLGVRGTDEIEYLGDSRWKFIKRTVSPEERKKPSKAENGTKKAVSGNPLLD